MPLLIAILAFVAVALGTVALLRPQPHVAARRMLGRQVPSPATQARLEVDPFRRLVVPAMSRGGQMMVALLPHNLVGRIDRTLEMANSRLTLVEFLGIWLGSAVGGFLLLSYIGAVGTRLSNAHLVLVNLFIGSVFFLGPYLLLWRRAVRRKRQVRRALPDALDLLVTAIEAGLGVDAAIALVAERTTGPLAESFVSYLRQVGLGRARRDAFQDVANRTGVDDFIRLAASVAQAEQVGTSLGDVMRQLADDIRLLRWQRAQEAAQKAPVWMTIPLALFFLPAMVAVVVVPSALNILNFVSTLGSR